MAAATNGTGGPETTEQPASAEHVVRATRKRPAAPDAAASGGTAEAKPRAPRRRTPRAAIAAEIRETAEEVLEQQRSRAAGAVQGVADTLRDTAGQLEQQRVGVLADYAERAAQEVEHWSRTVRNKSVAELTEDAAALVRQRPGLFLAGAAGLGFLLGRFLKASKTARSGSDP